MFEVLSSIADLGRLPGPIFLAIGVFDGVHLGHRAVIERALMDARAANGTPVVVTFDPHPIRVLRPDKAPHLLTSTRHKRRLIRDLGVHHLLIIPFDASFAATPAEDFIRQLASASDCLREICVGHQWSFGHGRSGNLELLRQLGDELGFAEVGIPTVEIGGKIVSSTLVRKAVEVGDFAAAASFLGRDYTVLGTVVEGRKLGRTLGFPTANLSAHNEQFPPNGVYAVEARRNGRSGLPGVANIGTRPSIAGGNGERQLEVHLFDLAENLYGEDLEIAFRHFLRPERRFASVDELRAQIARDVSEAMVRLKLPK